MNDSNLAVFPWNNRFSGCVISLTLYQPFRLTTHFLRLFSRGAAPGSVVKALQAPCPDGFVVKFRAFPRPVIRLKA